MNRSALVAAVLFAVACDQPLPVSPVALVPLLQTGAPTTRTNTWSALNYSFFSSCTGEVLLVTGRLHVESMVWNDSDLLRIQTHVNASLAAKGLTSGLTYHAQQITNQKHEMNWATGAAEADAVFVFNVISATEAPNFYLTMNGTWRYAADGTVAIEPKKWETICR
jgi:hypothetical protein